MADGQLGSGDLFRSRILGMGLEDTPYQQQNIGGMLGGATPEQLQSFFGSPQVQEQFKAFGIDPQQFTQNIRQSPFLPQSFMQQHPHLGGALSHAFANVAATPEAPLVSGAGSGMSRAMQGAMGGNDMIRQFQLHQMMAPFGMMAGMMPTYGEERRRAIEEAIVKSEQERLREMPGEAQRREEETMGRINTAQQKLDASKPAFNPYTGTVYLPHAAGTDAPVQGQMQGLGAIPGMQAPIAPGAVHTGGYERAPQEMQPTQQEMQQAHPERAGKGALDQAMAAYRQALLDEGRPEAEVDKLIADAEKARGQGAEARSKAAGGGKPGQGYTQKGASNLEETKGKAIQQLEGRYAGIVSKYSTKDAKGNPVLDEERWKKEDPGTYQAYFQARQEIEDQYTAAGRALGGTYPGYEYTERGQKSSLPKENPFNPGAAPAPGASPGSAQSGGPGSQTSEGTAVQKPSYKF